MYIHLGNSSTYVSCLEAQKHPGPKPSVPQEVGHFDFLRPFWPNSMPYTSMNSSYRYNPQSSHSVNIIRRPCIWKVIKSFRLCYTWWAWWCSLFPSFNMKHQPLITSTYNFFTKLVTHVEGVTQNLSVHQYCAISIAPPTAHRKSDKHHDMQEEWLWKCMCNNCKQL